MKKIYLLLVFIGILCFSFTPGIQAQSISLQKENPKSSEKIKGLKVFPNPVKGDVVFITSDQELTKTITVYSVLGGKLMFKVLYTKELNISELNSGVYILKITEGEKEHTQKLFVIK